jgi:formiminotetrahydrofolate cyclodeaminase
VTVALAGALVEMAARYADDAAAATAAADLRARAEPLADRDAEAYAAYLSARRDRRTGSGDDGTVYAAAVAATTVPVELAELAAAVATLGARLATGGNPRLRGDAMAGVQLAAAAAAAGSGLARENVGPEHPLAVRAARAAGTARAALAP